MLCWMCAYIYYINGMSRNVKPPPNSSPADKTCMYCYMWILEQTLAALNLLAALIIQFFDFTESRVT